MPCHVSDLESPRRVLWLCTLIYLLCACGGFGLTPRDISGEKSKGGKKSGTEAVRQHREAKAAKADDTKVPVDLWNARVAKGCQGSSMAEAKLDWACNVLWEWFLLRRWKQNLWQSFAEYLQEEYGVDWLQERDVEDLRVDLVVGCEALRVAMLATWWAWEARSVLFFWRWPREFRKEARDGTPVRIQGHLPKYRKPQRMEQDEVIREKLFSKITKIRARGYVRPGAVVSLTSFFSIPKDVTDIRMVYDATKSGLNDVVWVPSFGLPTVDSTLRGIEFSTYLGDIDLGEMFLNFPLDPKIRPYAGVDLTPFGAMIGGDIGTAGGVIWEHWEWCLMGFKPSPYNAVRAFGWCEDIIQGYERDLGNPLRWDRVRLNLPGQLDYNPTLPWVSNTFDSNGSEQIARDFFTYMDDIRICGQDDDHCWDVT